MFPSIKNGDILIISKISFPIKLPFLKEELRFLKISINKNDLVVFENDKGEILIKRLIGMPFNFYGYQDQQITTSEEFLKKRENFPISEEENLLFPNSSKFLPLLENGRIPEGYYLLLGDNRDYSTDSRTFGLVPESNLRGKVLWNLSN